jgi:hypothetical protein
MRDLSNSIDRKFLELLPDAAIVFTGLQIVHFNRVALNLFGAKDVETLIRADPIVIDEEITKQAFLNHQNEQKERERPIKPPYHGCSLTVTLRAERNAKAAVHRCV